MIMEKKDLRIVYMGTPEFAVESLRRLVEGGYNVLTNQWDVMAVFFSLAR